ncbi:TPA: transposase, partial [Enterobacter asburiae]|nr:transposase [Enterobacter asburiae]
MDRTLSWVTSKELVELDKAPSAISTIIRKAKKEGWIFRQRAGVKGVVFEYDIQCIPLDWQNELKDKYYKKLISNKELSPATQSVRNGITPVEEKGSKLNIIRQCPALLEREVNSLTEKQKQVADARATLALYVEKLRDAGMSRTAAVNFVSMGSRNGTLPEHLMNSAE